MLFEYDASSTKNTNLPHFLSSKLLGNIQILLVSDLPYVGVTVNEFGGHIHILKNKVEHFSSKFKIMCSTFFVCL